MPALFELTHHQIPPQRRRVNREQKLNFSVYSDLMEDWAMTLRHLSMSVATRLASASGGPGSTSSPCAARADFTLSVFKSSLISWLSRMTIAGGVPAGANTASQSEAS